MTTDTLAAALEREHHEIDHGIEAFLAAPDDPQPLIDAITALRRHIYLEEEFVFPPLQDGGMVAPVFVMLREHGEIWDALDQLEAQLARDGGDPAAGETCRDLLNQLDRHNSKEEPIIYPQADAALGPEEVARLRDYLAAGELPLGWVCARATR